VDLRLLGADGHLLAATPGDRAHVRVLRALCLDDLTAGIVDLLFGEGDFKAHQARGLEKAGRVLLELEDLATVNALTFENG
jgi:hypothetical protein